MKPSVFLRSHFVLAGTMKGYSGSLSESFVILSDHEIRSKLLFCK